RETARSFGEMPEQDVLRPAPRCLQSQIVQPGHAFDMDSDRGCQEGRTCKSPCTQATGRAADPTLCYEDGIETQPMQRNCSPYVRRDPDSEFPASRWCEDLLARGRCATQSTVRLKVVGRAVVHVPKRLHRQDRPSAKRRKPILTVREENRKRPGV